MAAFPTDMMALLDTYYDRMGPLTRKALVQVRRPPMAIGRSVHGS